MSGPDENGIRCLKVLVNAVNDNSVPRGPDRYLMEILPAMRAADPGLDFSVMHAPWQVQLRDAISAFGIATQQVEPPRRPVPRLLWQALRFPRLADGSRADIVFLPNLIWTPGMRTPSVMTVHDLLQFRAPEKFGLLKAKLLQRVVRRALARSVHVVAVSDFTAADAIRFAGLSAARMDVVKEGGPPPRPRADRLEDDGSFLFVGKIENTKGVDDLVRAFAQSRILANLGSHLRIVGPDGNAAVKLDALLAKAEARVERLGFVSEDHLDALYCSCRGFVFPSKAEGFGLVVLEAMARGAPVIAARATSLPEVLGPAGLLVEPGDVDALCAAMERLATDDELYLELQRRGYDRLNDFSWAEAGARTALILRNAVG